MGNELDDFVQDLQNKIFDETRRAYGDVAFERWSDPLYMGSIDDPDGYACLTGSCGDTMQIFLKFEDDRVKEASFQTSGCGSSTVCGSFAAEMALGKGPDELVDVTGEAILKKLGALPREEEHCAFLAGQTLQEALEDYMKRQSRKGTESTDCTMGFSA
ncbi:MAG: iron-sulfur cluster assembly scaffold protein [Thermodesulfobacteriota bacterium]|nr:iron-sulfur cluster assembly scaffold protein [Thermodesulfobacteriota bacterium]